MAGARNIKYLPGKEKVVSELKKLAKNADKVYLATDLDREGEAIAWHLKEAIGGDPDRFKRVVFNEITKRAIQDAFSEPGELDMRYVEAQQARRFLDRVVGFMVSPLCCGPRWLGDYRQDGCNPLQCAWWLNANRKFVLLILKNIGKCSPISNRPDRTSYVARWSGSRAAISGQTTKSRQTGRWPHWKRPTIRSVSATTSQPHPNHDHRLITSTLQQAASTRLGFGVKKTMMMAQRLYEAGYITYMRTDATHLSDDAINMARDYIKDQFGDRYLPADPVRYSSREGAQEAHEAIRPTDVKIRAEQLQNMEQDAVRLYTLIWQFFLACQMPRAEYLSSTLTISAADFELRAKGRIMKFDGYLKVMPGKEDDVVLPALEVGDALQLQKLDPVQNFHQATTPFHRGKPGERAGEKRDIGRPSTYAVDHFDNPGSWLCKTGKQAFPRLEDG